MKRHVGEKGYVDYDGMEKDLPLLKKALASFRNGPPGPEAKEDERMAFWIDAYNAFAIKLVLDHRPLESIRDIDRAFDREFIDIGERSYSLNGIEKGILLEEFDEPKVHYAVNCASISCPPLRGEPYRSDILDRQLEDQAERFINDPSKNELKKDRVRISKLYDWYTEDFKRNGSLIEHLNRYAEGVKIRSDAEVAYKEYDWGLNQKDR